MVENAVIDAQVLFYFHYDYDKVSSIFQEFYQEDNRYTLIYQEMK